MKLLDRIRSWLPVGTLPIEEAEQQQLGKGSKIDTATDALFLDSLYKSDFTARALQKAHQSKLLGVAPPDDKGDDEMIIADNITRVDRHGIGPLGALGLAAVAAGLTWFLLKPDESPPTTVTVPGQSETIDYEVDSRIVTPEE